MPTFVSDKGVFHPAKEKVSLKYNGKKSIARDKLPKGVTISGDSLNPGDDFLYDGPDREALKVIFKENPDGSTIGEDFRRDPDFIQMTRTRGFNTVDDYLKSIGYDEAKDTEKFQKKAASVKAHEVADRVSEIEVLGGGKDFTGSGADTIGGFGEERVRTPNKK